MQSVPSHVPTHVFKISLKFCQYDEFVQIFTKTFVPDFTASRGKTIVKIYCFVINYFVVLFHNYVIFCNQCSGKFQ